MPLTLSQQDYQDLFTRAEQHHYSQPHCSQSLDSQGLDSQVLDSQALESQTPNSPLHLAPFNRSIPYPKLLGTGQFCSLDLRPGLSLSIEDYQLHGPVVVESPARSHPIEYTFLCQPGPSATASLVPQQYWLYGSGTAPAERVEMPGQVRTLAINVHLDPATFQDYLGSTTDLASAGLAHLVQPLGTIYYQGSGVPTIAMQTTVHQLLDCPFQGMSRKMYLESKVWELMALLLVQETAGCSAPPLRLKADDIERIHQARQILLSRVENPPSLLDLARQVGLNDCTLKRGFREVFGTTAFGCLHEYRLEQARQLLANREMNVSEVAHSVGFRSASSLSRAFRKKYGVSPKQYSRWKAQPL